MQRLFAVRKLLSSALSPMRPRWSASFSTSLLFDDTQLQLKESVSQFAQENIAPHAAKIDRSNYFPKEVNLWKLMGDFNLHGITSSSGCSFQHIHQVQEKKLKKIAEMNVDPLKTAGNGSAASSSISTSPESHFANGGDGSEGYS